MWVVVVQAPPGADTLRATFPGRPGRQHGARGWRRRAGRPGRRASPTSSRRSTVEALAGSEVVASREATLYDGGFLGEHGDSRECIPPPPALPAAGEQPADVEAARAGGHPGVRGRLQRRRARGGRGPPPSTTPTCRWRRSGEQLRYAAPYADQVAIGHALVRELVFTAPDHAWVLYDVLTGDTPAVTDRFGEAVLVDGTWKVTEATLCQDIALAGITCCAPPLCRSEP